MNSYYHSRNNDIIKKEADYHEKRTKEEKDKLETNIQEQRLYAWSDYQRVSSSTNIDFYFHSARFYPFVSAKYQYALNSL